MGEMMILPPDLLRGNDEKALNGIRAFRLKITV